MPTHSALLRPPSRARRSQRPAAEHHPSPSTDRPSWSAGVLQALAHAGAMGLFLPPATWFAPGGREETR